jgi:glycosyltransferase involved in cell wall biosynthesis
LPQHRAVLAAAKEAQATYSLSAPSVKLSQQYDLALHVGRGPKIGFPIFELDWFDARERHMLRSQDHLIVCSEWARNVLRANDIDVPVSIVPLGVDRTIFNELVESPGELPLETVFMNIGKLEDRKGHDVLFRAFHAAFQPTDPVRLLVLGHNPRAGADFYEIWHREYIAGPMADRITLLTMRMPTQREVAQFMTVADCAVFPARAEGWNLELPEFLAMGKPVIATNVTGHTAYLTDANATRIELREMVQARQGSDYQGRYWQFDEQAFEQLVESLRAVHRERQSRGALPLNTAGIATSESLSWANAARRMAEAVTQAIG